MTAARRPALNLAMNEGEPPDDDCFDLLRQAGAEIFREYGDPKPLEEAYAAYLGVRPGQVLATTGGDDAIDRVCRACLSPDKRMVFPTPTFYMIPAYARMTGGRLAPLQYEWETLPCDQILAAVDDSTGLVAVISPDNPTGHAFPASALTKLARALPEDVPLMVDMAYAEFADEDPVQELLRCPGVVMIRTMSKCWGLAGLRIGFAVGSEKRITALRAFGGPYALSGPALVIGHHALRHRRDQMHRHVAYARSGRKRLAELVRATGGEPQPSATNFVLARYPDARWIFRGLKAQGILVRTFDPLPDYVRITVPRNDAEFALLEDKMRNLAQPEAVLFDMDGVLADVRRSYRAVIVATCKSFGVTVGSTEIEAAKSRGHANDDWTLTRSLLENAGVRASWDVVVSRFEALYQGTEDAPGLRRRESLIPSRDTLETLAGRAKLGVVTGRPRQDAERFLREHRLQHLFGAVVCREDTPLKPDPAPVRAAMDQLSAASAWMLGDTPDDVCAAIAAGVVPIGVAAPGAGDRMRRTLDASGAARLVEATETLGGLLE